MVDSLIILHTRLERLTVIIHRLWLAVRRLGHGLLGVDIARREHAGRHCECLKLPVAQLVMQG